MTTSINFTQEQLEAILSLLYNSSFKGQQYKQFSELIIKFENAYKPKKEIKKAVKKPVKKS